MGGRTNSPPPTEISEHSASPVQQPLPESPPLARGGPCGVHCTRVRDTDSDSDADTDFDGMDFNELCDFLNESDYASGGDLCDSDSDGEQATPICPGLPHDTTRVHESVASPNVDSVGFVTGAQQPPTLLLDVSDITRLIQGQSNEPDTQHAQAEVVDSRPHLEANSSNRQQVSIGLAGDACAQGGGGAPGIQCDIGDPPINQCGRQGSRLPGLHIVQQGLSIDRTGQQVHSPGAADVSHAPFASGPDHQPTSDGYRISGDLDRQGGWVGHGGGPCAPHFDPGLRHDGGEPLTHGAHCKISDPFTPDSEALNPNTEKIFLGDSDGGDTIAGGPTGLSDLIVHSGPPVYREAYHHSHSDTPCQPDPVDSHDVQSSPDSPGYGGVVLDNNSVFTSAHLLDIYDRVAACGQYNYLGARLPVPSGLNLDNWKQYLTEEDDPMLLQFLTYGWPVSATNPVELISTAHNHPSAAAFGGDIEHYLETELGYGAILGPFREPPFPNYHCSPLMTRHKKGSPHRRVILDLSWPKGAALNDCIPDGEYMGEAYIFHLPTVDFMAKRLRELGPGAYMYKTDLARAYRQLRVDPVDWPLLGMTYNGQYYFDICPPFGMRTSALMMQRTTSAVTTFHGRAGFITEAYIDDMGGAEDSYRGAGNGLASLQHILHDLGLEENPEKVVPPTQRLTWLGIEFDSVAMTMRIPDSKIQEINVILNLWDDRRVANRTQVQSLLGLLNFVGAVSPPARVYTNRILHFLRAMPPTGFVEIDTEFREDLKFFNELFPAYNGISIINKTPVNSADSIELDACLTGCGAICSDQYYSCTFPHQVLGENHHISHLETLNIVVALRLWAPKYRGRTLTVYTDNTTACAALTSGRSRDPYLARCARAMFVCITAADVQVLVYHRPGLQLECADALSRAHLSDRFNDIVDSIADSKVRVFPSADMFVLND